MDVRMALTGFGNVGRGVATLLIERGLEYERRYGVRLLLTGVADQGGAVVDPNGLDPMTLLGTKRRVGTVSAAPGGVAGLKGAEFLDQAQAQVLLEAASTNFTDAEPGWSYLKEALARDMDVVLASKGALVLHFGEIFNEAAARGRRVLFGATVGAPLPILELADRMLVGSEITGFDGIVNGTSNVILTKMQDGASYDEGVRAAQEMGIAETDPTLDVDGWDAAAKAVIISNAILGADLQLGDVQREGIRGLTRRDLLDAEMNGQSIRLTARARKTPQGVVAHVSPERRPLADPLGRLRNDEMGIILYTDPLGRVDATVQMTGGLATALTMLRDVVNLARDCGWTTPPRP